MRVDRAHRRRRRGVALLEAIVALVILTTVGLAALRAIHESGRASERAHEADRVARNADAFLAVVSLWTRDDLDRRLGTHDQGPYRLTIGRSSAATYDLALGDSTGRVLLATSIYRPIRGELTEMGEQEASR